MKLEDFQFVSGIIKEQSGLVLKENKTYLLESRLSPLARRRGMANLDEMVQALRLRPDPALIREITEAMTTNESFFFRDIKPFDLFRDKVLPKIIDARAGQKKLRIWCAAASTGQEPYSLAIILKEMAARLSGWRVDIVGTDISSEVLTKAKAGLYSQFEVQRGMPIQFLVKYFKQQDEMWQIDPSLRSMVEFKEYNLLHDLNPLGKFDIVFCRNVLIYFDQETKGKVLENIARLMPEDGTLFLGGAETVLGVSDSFEPVQGERGIYKVMSKKGGVAPLTMSSRLGTFQP